MLSQKNQIAVEVKTYRGGVTFELLFLDGMQNDDSSALIPFHMP